jgi:polar amino acid transport system substrate-binding protein
VQRGEADVAIAGISVTAEREQVVDFSHPYLHGGLQVLVAASRVPPLWRQLTRMVSWPFLVLGGSFFLLVLGMAHLMWLGERWHPASHMPRRYGPGIWQALWWATVTVTTVGYGDVTPKGVVGRLLAMLWMFASIFLLAHFTATMTTYTTLRALQGTITSVEDLPGKRLVTVQGSTAAHYLTQRSLTHQTVATIEEAYPLLEQGHVEAVVYDAPVLLAYAATTGQGRVQAVGPIFVQEPYSIALQLASPYRKAINRALLALTQDGTYQRLYTRWFGHVAPVK